MAETQGNDSSGQPPFWTILAAAGILLLIYLGIGVSLRSVDERKYYEVERTEHNAPPETSLAVLLGDDKVADKKPPVFDPSLIDRRPLDEWQFNASAAMIHLDVPMTLPDLEPALMTLYPSYADAMQAASRVSGRNLPSLNLIDGKAKQFDDGLYAALDQAYFKGLDDKLRSHVALVEALARLAGPDDPAAPFLAAGLELAGVKIEVVDKAWKDRWLAEFSRDVPKSKPIGFYTWNETLATTFRFLRFFQNEFAEDDLVVPKALAGHLAKDDGLRADYRKAVGFYAKLTNPPRCRSVLDLIEPAGKRVSKYVALFPSSTSREDQLFERLFPEGLPKTELMRELVQRIRSGEVDLAPRPDSGWYDRQVFALETLLLPGRGEEADKLILSANYKKRALEAFQALVTKRRETHARQLEEKKTLGEGPIQQAPRPKRIAPRLRLEPSPTYLVRTARAYAFLENFLLATVGEEALRSLHGLKADGERKLDLATELKFQRNLFYGLYLVSCEDLGLRPKLEAEEQVDQAACYEAAIDWLRGDEKDADLAADTRVSVPIFLDADQGKTRLWVTLGVRLVKLEASYAREHRPSIRTGETGPWSAVDPDELAESHYVIAVDEFAEVELPGLTTLSREELRKICDQGKTKEAILQAMGRVKP